MNDSRVAQYSPGQRTIVSTCNANWIIHDPPFSLFCAACNSEHLDFYVPSICAAFWSISGFR